MELPREVHGRYRPQGMENSLSSSISSPEYTELVKRLNADRDIPFNEIYDMRLRAGSFQDVLNCKETRLDIHVIIELFNHVRPKLNHTFEEAQDRFLANWNAVHDKIHEYNIHFGRDSAELLDRVDQIHRNRSDRFNKSIKTFSDVGEKFSERLFSQLQTNETDLTSMLLTSPNLLPSVFNLFRDIDELSRDIVEMFAELNDFLVLLTTHCDKHLTAASLKGNSLSS